MTARKRHTQLPGYVDTPRNRPQPERLLGWWQRRRKNCLRISGAKRRPGRLQQGRAHGAERGQQNETNARVGDQVRVGEAAGTPMLGDIIAPAGSSKGAVEPIPRYGPGHHHRQIEPSHSRGCECASTEAWLLQPEAPSVKAGSIAVHETGL